MTLTWKLGHRGHYGIKEADVLAQEDPHKIIASPEPFCEVAMVFIKQ